jgi:SlyX protein
MDKRITDLEIKVAFQEDTISQLDNVVCLQQRRIDTLENHVNQLLERTLELSQQGKGAANALTDDLPPHY